MGRFMNYPVRWSFLPVGWGFRRATGSKLFTKLYPRGITFVLYKFYHGGNDLMIFYHIVQETSAFAFDARSSYYAIGNDPA